MEKEAIKYVDYSKVWNQIGCGYCYYEIGCKERDPKINKAKLGCKKWVHYKEKQINQ